MHTNFKPENEQVIETLDKLIYQCARCHSIYDEETGEPEQNILPGVPFAKLPPTFCCPLCESEKTTYHPIPKSRLNLCLPN